MLPWVQVTPARPTGYHKAFLFWVAAEGLASAAFQSAWQAVRWVANEPRPMPGPAPLAFDGIDEIWLADGCDVQPIFDAMVARLADHVDAPACCFVVVEEFTTRRLRG